MIDLVDVVKAIEERKKAENIAPSHAMFSEIVAEVGNMVKPELRQLCQDGRLDWCETLNSFAFSTKK